ncbi:MAG: hypothetical protein WBP93_21325 [Pyrinomonadaceae bacterium]
MSKKKDQKDRGSTKLWDRVFESGPPAPEQLSRGISDARVDYKVLRWWWYGQPAVDLVKVTVDAPIATAGQFFQDILRSHGQEAQVTLDVFPYGIPFPDWVRFNVVFERNINPVKR